MDQTKITKKSLLPLGIFFIISSTLILEISLVRIFSVTLYQVNAFLAISTALFGLAFGGILVYLLPEYFKQENFEKVLSATSLIYPLSIIGVIVFLVCSTFDAEKLSLISSIEIFSLAAIPFVIANILLSFVFKFESKKISHLYFFDLLGAGIGVVAAVLLMNFFSAINVLLLTAAVGFIGAMFFNYQNKIKMLIALACVGLAIAASGYNQTTGVLEIKSLYNKFDYTSINVTLSKWNSFSHISLDRNGQKYMASLPEDLNLALPTRWSIRIDGGAYTEINQFNGDLGSLNYLNSDLSSLAMQLEPAGHILVIGPGGGRDVTMGLINGHHVTAAEINPIIINDIMLGQAKEFSGGLYTRPDVKVIISEGRSFINQDQNKYDVITIPLVDTWASTAGGNLALVENNLYTVEAFEQYLTHLTPSGMLTISRWSYDGAKLVTLYLEAAKKLGIENPEKNIAIAAVKNLNNYIFKTTPFTQEEINFIKTFSKSKQYYTVYLPGEKITGMYTEYLTSNNQKEFIKNYPQNIEATYDDRPFFFFIVPSLKDLFNVNYKYQDGGLTATAITVFMLTLFLVIFPAGIKLIGKNDQHAGFKQSAKYIFYFMGLGLSFILIEVALIQKFILYLEKPIYSYSVVLATILVAASLGSFLSQKITVGKTTLLKITGLIFLLVLFNTQPLKNIIIDNTISFGISYKILLTVLVVAPISLLMGMLLPLGIKKIDAAGLNQIIPWAWSLNGAASVFGSIIAIIIAIFYGFNVVLLTGGVLYLLAASLLSYQKQ